MFDTLSSLYDALTPVLGLGDLDALSAQLATTRLNLDAQRKAVNGDRDLLLTRLDPDDGRAALVASAIGGRKPDLAQLEALLEETPSYTEDLTLLRRLAGLALPTDEQIRDAYQDLKGAQRAVEDASATDAARATNLASLLRKALAVRDPDRLTDDCPVCKTPDVLDEAWATAALEEAAQLEEQAQALTHANTQLTTARRRVDALLDGNALAAPLAARHLGLLEDDLELPRDTEDEVRQSTPPSAPSPPRPARSSSARARPGRSSRATCAAGSSRPRRSRPTPRTLKAIKDAEKWLKGATDELQTRALRADLAERDRQLAGAAAGVERRPARDHAQEGRQGRPRGLRRPRRRHRGQRARRDVARASCSRSPSPSSCRAPRSTSRRSASP